VLGLLPEVEVVGSACDGDEATRLLRDRVPQTKVVVLTTYADDRSVIDARDPNETPLMHDYRNGLGFLFIQQVRFLVLAGKEQGRDDGHPDEREGHPVGVGERVRGLG
jgi:hypothetical protein